MKEKKELIQYTAVCVFILCLIFHYWDTAASWLLAFLHVINPLLVGCAMAYILNLVMSFYERTLLARWKAKPSLKRAGSILLSLMTFLLVLTLIINMIVPELKSCMEILLSNIPMVCDAVIRFLDKYFNLPELLPAALEHGLDVRDLLSRAAAWITSGAGASLFGYISSFVSVLFNLFVSLVLAIYLLAGKEWLGHQLDRLASAWIPAAVKEKGYHVLRTLNNSFHSFIVGQCTEAVILGTLCILGMLLFRLPYAVMIGVLVGATALIPIFGAYIGAIVGVIMIFTESPIQSLIFLLFIIVLQQLENQLIYPRVVGTSIGLPGIFVFSAVMIGGSLFGVAGVLLGIPLAAACYQLLREQLQKKERA